MLKRVWIIHSGEVIDAAIPAEAQANNCLEITVGIPSALADGCLGGPITALTGNRIFRKELDSLRIYRKKKD